MAMNLQSNDTPVATGNNGNYEKAKGFLNFGLPNEEGGVSKVGAIPLKASNPDHVELMNLLTEGDEKAKEKVIKMILKNLSLTYNSAEKKARGIKLA